MKKGTITGLMAFFLAVAVMMWPCAAQAAELAGTWNVSGYAAAALPGDENSDLEETLYLSGRLSYNYSEYLELGVEAGWHEYEDKSGGVDFGDLSGIPVLAIAMLKYPVEQTDNKLVPYLIGGVGAVFWDYDESAAVSAAGIDIESDTALGLKAGLGFDYYVSDMAAVFFEASYLWSDYDVKIAGISGASTDVDMGTYFVGGGLKLTY